MSELKVTEEDYLKRKGKCSIPERRRCPSCHTKSYSKFIGKIEISAYHCEKCEYIFHILTAPTEFLEIPQSLWPQLTVNDLERCLEFSFYRCPITQERLLGPLRGPLGLREQMDIILNEVSLMENTNGVELNSLLKALKSKHNIDEDNALRLIKQLIKENLIYEPKKGYFKRKI